MFAALDVVTYLLQTFNDINFDPWILVILFSVLVGTGIFVAKTNRHSPEKPKEPIDLPDDTDEGTETGDKELDEIIKAAGYSYDRKQDIFYSNLNPWQRRMGYCRLYDEASAPLGMIIDCEPIYFEYGGKRWMIEFWKGQYDLPTGCEVGVYTTEQPDLSIPGVFRGTFYYCASDEDLLEMSYSLKKNGKIIFSRDDKHWWLTGFKLGEFSEPSELTMDINITLKDEAMRNAFVKGLRKAGYLEKEIKISGNTVSLKFDKPRTPQPITRTEETDWIVQRKNKLLCDMYQDITGPYDNFPDKIKAVRKESPELYELIMNIGKTKQLFEAYEKIKRHLK